MFSKFLTVVVIIFLSLISYGQKEGMALIKGGQYIPLYGTDSNIVKVQDFYIDQYPVTNAEYVKFLEDNPKWRKSNVIALYADGNYLRHFKDDLNLKDGELENAPMTNVSYFAAKKYCECQGKRLPTLDEWEYVGMADEKDADARTKDEYNKFILSWYEKPNSYNQEVGSTFENYWGVYDMHGLVWEWTQDFNSVLISGESRSDVDGGNDLFCGGAALGSSDLMNYAAFMRYAFRGSVKANYSIRNLGFRCAKSIN
ncbi:formylglycine-generating enzyme family protein [Brumimicrobium sp.]|uniref:formylglycine-generating enzyme family protein n=1 Tax=Brumimicrobium sp. TaxID=2029867 RepID=UPI00260CF993|nr:formylglycine-generating enzyme family protein [uncultured Brumimicrobium sp.]